MIPFHLRFALTRRQRLAAELYPWLPCLAACLGFTLGVAFLSANVSRWFLPLLALPPVVCRNFLAFLLTLATRPLEPVDIDVDGTAFAVRLGSERCRRPLAGIIQVVRSEDRTTWTVLHLDGSAVTIPADAIAPEQVEYLKSFPRRAAARAAPPGRLIRLFPPARAPADTPMQFP